MPYPKTIPYWLEIALAELGVHETAGPGSTARINEYLKTCSLAPSDEIPWCSAFMNWIFNQCAMDGTKSGLARSWLNWGEVTEPHIGSIVILTRPEAGPQAGHVGFQIDQHDGFIYVLGGNQGDRVGVSRYLSAQVIGYRKPKTLFSGVNA